MKEQQEVRSIWANIKMIIQGVADALGSVTNAAGSAANIANELAMTGEVMAISNRKLVSIEVEGKEREALESLNERFPELLS